MYKITTRVRTVLNCATITSGLPCISLLPSNARVEKNKTHFDSISKFVTSSWKIRIIRELLFYNSQTRPEFRFAGIPADDRNVTTTNTDVSRNAFEQVASVVTCHCGRREKRFVFEFLGRPMRLRTTLSFRRPKVLTFRRGSRRLDIKTNEKKNQSLSLCVCRL